MSFLTPLFLLGALAVALPIFFHLIRRTAKERLPFSSVMFLMPSPPRVTKRSRLENLALLILRSLIVCLLAFAFARPFLSRPAAEGLAQAEDKRTVVLLDTSASMRRPDLWEEALRRVENVVRRAQESDRLALVTFDRQPRTLSTFEEWASFPAGARPSEIRLRLEGIEPSWYGTALSDAILHAVQLLEEGRSPAKEAVQPQEIVVVSDLQEGCRLDGLQGYEWARDLRISLEVVAPREAGNAGLHWIAAGFGSDGRSGAGGSRLRVINSADARSERFRVRARRLGGEEPIAAVDTYVPPGQSRLISFPDLAGRSEPVEFRLEGDPYDFDNSVFWAPRAPETARVAYFGTDQTNNPAHAAFFIRRALQSTDRRQVEFVDWKSDEAFAGAPQSEQTHVLIVNDALPKTAATAARRWVQDGGIAVVLMSSRTAALAASALLGLETLAADEAQVRNYALLAEIDFQHPLFRTFADPRYSDFTKIHFWRYRRLDASQIPQAEVVARFDSRDPAILHVPEGQGAVLLFTFGWSPDESQFVLSSKFVPMLFSILGQAGFSARPDPQYLAGDAVPVADAATEAAVQVQQPDGSLIGLEPGRRDVLATVPGIYQVDSGTNESAFAVNLAPEESRTLPIPTEHLSQLGLPLLQPDQPQPSAQELTTRRIRHQAAELESQQKIWRWVILVAVGALLIETIWAGRLSRLRPASG